MQKVQKASFVLIILMVFLFIIGQACETGGSNRESIENDSEMLEGNEIPQAVDSVQTEPLDSAEISDMRRLEEEGVKYRQVLDSIARANPNISYTYTPAKGGPIKTVLGEYKVKVDGVSAPEEKESIAVLLAKSFENRQSMLYYYNKLNNVDIPASPKGGFAKFYEELRKNLEYPEETKSLDVEGLLFVQLAIERSGELSDIKISESIDTPDDELEEKIKNEAIEAIKKTQSQWNPAKKDGQPVRSKLEIPVWLDSDEIQS